MADEQGRSDEELLAASIEEPALYLQFYDRHARDLLTFFARRTFDSRAAADLTAETAAEAFASRFRYADQGPGSAAAWLFTIARRQLGAFVRRRRVATAARQKLGVPRIELTSSDMERVEELMDLRAMARAIASAFESLRPADRQALTLRVIDGRSYLEVARAMGCSEQTARARVSRGLRRLATSLEAAE